MDLDGDLDLMAVNGFAAFASDLPEDRLITGPGYLLENRGGAFVRFMGTDLDVEEDARALVAFDADSDGDRGLLITMDGPARLLDNQSTREGVVYIALSPPAFPFGATLRAVVGGVHKRRDALPARSYIVGADASVRFGLAADASLRVVEVQWADGARTQLPMLAAGDRVEARRCEGVDECAASPGAIRCICVDVPTQGGCAVSEPGTTHTTLAVMLSCTLLLLLSLARRREVRRNAQAP